jgi:hypothetical protein
MRSSRPRHQANGMTPSMAATLLALLLGASGCAIDGPAPLPMPDPANPLELNEVAVASAARGDIETAWLLLERAARLAPHDARITANLAAMREFRRASPHGKIVGAAAPGIGVPK